MELFMIKILHYSFALYSHYFLKILLIFESLISSIFSAIGKSLNIKFEKFLNSEIRIIKELLIYNINTFINFFFKELSPSSVKLDPLACRTR